MKNTKTYKITIGSRGYSTYIVEANNADEATELALSGEVDYETHEEYDYEIDGVEEIDVPLGEETTEVIDTFDVILHATGLKEN